MSSPTTRPPPPPGPARYIFLPADYRLRAVAGWRDPVFGFVPDEPLSTREGILLRIREK